MSQRLRERSGRPPELSHVPGGPRGAADGRGFTNREVAAALFLSPRTVEHRLGSVFRKRGRRSGGELIRAFAAGPGGAVGAEEHS